VTLVYLDTSAITKLAIQELGSADLRAEIDGGRWVTSRIAVVEVSKAVGRVAPALDLAPIFERLAFVEIDEGLAGRVPGRVAPASGRSTRSTSRRRSCSRESSTRSLRTTRARHPRRARPA